MEGYDRGFANLVLMASWSYEHVCDIASYVVVLERCSGSYQDVI